MIFRKWGGGGQRPFGTFPKIHPFWKGQASLNRCKFWFQLKQLVIVLCSVFFFCFSSAVFSFWSSVFSSRVLNFLFSGLICSGLLLYIKWILRDISTKPYEFSKQKLTVMSTRKEMTIFRTNMDSVMMIMIMYRCYSTSGTRDCVNTWHMWSKHAWEG